MGVWLSTPKVLGSNPNVLSPHCPTCRHPWARIPTPTCCLMTKTITVGKSVNDANKKYVENLDCNLYPKCHVKYCLILCILPPFWNGLNAMPYLLGNNQTRDIATLRGCIWFVLTASCDSSLSQSWEASPSKPWYVCLSFPMFVFSQIPLSTGENHQNTTIQSISERLQNCDYKFPQNNSASQNSCRRIWTK